MYVFWNKAKENTPISAKFKHRIQDNRLIFMSIYTEALFRENSYLKSCHAKVIHIENNQIILDKTVFCPLGGGQPGDSGLLKDANGELIRVLDTKKGESRAIIHICDCDLVSMKVGDSVLAEIDW
jgi:misacylated tRNA(Ala) deacylase